MKNSKSTIAKKGSNKKVLNVSNIEEANVLSTELMIIPKDAPETKKLSQSTLDALIALNVSESIKPNADRKSIFKKEFNNKADRTKCRTKFINAISLYILHLQHNKIDLAKESLQKINDIAIVYYQAENKFSSYLDYCSENMDDNKKNLIKSFINVNQELNTI